MASQFAGVFSGIAGVLVFLLIHHFWITPIWFVLPLGLMIAGIGGAVVGWAYTELQPGLPPRPWTTLAMAILIVVILLPAIILAELRRPLFDVTGNEAALSVTMGKVATIFVLELLVTSASVGGIAGLLIGRSWQAALATALAGFIFALGPGHNIPLIGGTSGVGKEIVIMIAIILVSALVLVETHHFLSRTRSV